MRLYEKELMHAQFQPEPTKKPIGRASQKRYYPGSVGTGAVQSSLSKLWRGFRVVRSRPVLSLASSFVHPPPVLFFRKLWFLMYYALAAAQEGWLPSCTTLPPWARFGRRNSRIASEGEGACLLDFCGSFPPASEREARMDDPTRRCEKDIGI